MGILGLARLLQDKCPECIKEVELKNLFGRRIAIDASMSIYQFIIAMKGFDNGQVRELTNANGEVTSHLNGLLTRAIRMMEEGLKPIYVFDGKPPELKSSHTLIVRREKAEKATAAFEQAKEEGDDALMEKMSKRTVRVSPEQVADCKRLFELMGVPTVQAPGEAEAQCVELVKSGQAWAVATEDMDALTFGCPILLRQLNYNTGGGKDRKIQEYHLQVALEHAGFTTEQFIDLCILLGCDYSTKVPGIGPVKAWDGIEKHKTIEDFIAALDQTKYSVPEDFNYIQARELFKQPDITPARELTIDWKTPDAEGLRKFLCDEKLFNRDRVDRCIARMNAVLKQKTQERIDNFFTVTKLTTGIKRPAVTEKDAGNKTVSGKLRKTEGFKNVKKAVKK